MNPEEEKIKKITETLKTISLKPEEKKILRANIESFVKFHPARELPRPLESQDSVLSFSLFFARYKFVPALIVLALILGTGVSFAAEGALPGDALYPIKVGLNENIRTAFAAGVEARAEWNVRQVERRLEEAEELAAENKFNAEASAEIEERFEDHIKELDIRLLEIHAEDKTEVAIRISEKLEKVLEIHARALAGNQDQAVSAVTAAAPALTKGLAEDSAATFPEASPVQAFADTLMEVRDRVKVQTQTFELEVETEILPEIESEIVPETSVDLDDVSSQNELDGGVGAEIDTSGSVDIPEGGATADSSGSASISGSGSVNVGF